MTIHEVDFKEYVARIKPDLIYNRAFFNSLNEYKVNAVRYFLFCDKKIRFGLCVGEENGNLFCPFSAPFSSFSVIKKSWTIEQLEEAVSCLDEQAECEKWKSLRFILPPPIYDTKLVSAMENILFRKGYCVKFLDLNYQFNLKKILHESYEKLLLTNGRKNLAIGLKSNLRIKHCEKTEEKEQAYRIIAVNRKAKGYPLRMTWDQVKNTIEIVDHDFFVVYHEEIPIASAQIFYVTEDIASVIYWGDIPGYTQMKPINYLAYQLIQYYMKRGLLYLDVGPSTEHGMPNYGLCNFKDSLGCDVSVKTTLEKEFSFD